MSSEWEKRKLGDLINIKHGFAFKSEFFSEIETPFQLVTPGNFAIGGGFQQGKGKYYSGDIPQGYVLKKGDVVVTMTDLSRGADTLGYAAVIPETVNTTWLHNQRVGLVQIANARAINTGFIHYLMRSSEYRHWIVASATGSTVKHTAPSRICSFEFMLPPIDEQIGIAGILSSLDDRITLLRETNATLESIAQALFKSWFVDFDPVRAKQQGQMPEGMDEATAALFPDSFEESELRLVPKGWTVGTVANIANFQNGYAFKTKDWQNSGHPVVKIGNVKPGIIDFSGASCVSSEIVVGLDKFKLRRGDLLVGMTGYVGETGLVTHIQPSAYLNQRVGRIATNSGIKDIGFVYSVVRNPAYKAFAESKSHGSAQANISGSDLISYPVVLPSNDLYHAFNEILSGLIEGILENYERAKTLADLRDTLLPRLISGQLRIAEAKEAVEEVIA